MVHYPELTGIAPYTYGAYPVYTRVRVAQSSSNGITLCDSKVGTYISIGAVVLSFTGIAEAMTVSTILSILNLGVSNDTYTEAKTFKSYMQYEKNGEARWSDETGYTPWVISAKRDYYKHILGATQNSSGQWTTKTKDYLSAPSSTQTGTFYSNSDSWFHEEARQRCQTGGKLIDFPF